MNRLRKKLIEYIEYEVNRAGEKVYSICLFLERREAEEILACLRKEGGDDE